MRKLNSLKLLLSALLLAIGCNVWGADYKITPDNNTSGSTSTSYITSLTEFTSNEISWKFNQWNPSTMQVKTNQSNAANEFRFYNTSAFPGKITKVVIKFSALTLSNTSTTGMKFVGGTSAVTGTTGGTDGVWNSTDKTLTWTPSASDNFTYFAFYQNGKVATGTNYLASSDAIVVTYSVSTIPSTVTFNLGDHGTFAEGEEFENENQRTEASAGAGVALPKVTANANYAFKGWSTANPATAATLVSAGTDGKYHPSTNTPLYAYYVATYTLTITQPAAGGTLTVKNGATTLATGATVEVGTNLTCEVTNIPEGKRFSRFYAKWGEEPSQSKYKGTNPATFDNIATEGITACEIYVTYQDLQKVTVNFYGVNNELISSSTKYEGSEFDVPSNPDDVLEYSFAGWAESAVSNETTTKPDFVEFATSTFTASEDKNYYAVYTKKIGSGETYTITKDNIPSAYNTSGESVTINGKVFVMTSVACFSRYSNNIQFAKNTSSITTNEDLAANITSIELTYATTNSYRDLTVNVNGNISPSINGNVYTFDCSSKNSKQFTIANSTSNTDNLDLIVITCGSSTTYYTSAIKTTYTRQTAANRFGTLCLPYDATVTGATLYTISGKTVANNVVTSISLEEVDGNKLEGGKGYFFLGTGSDLVATYTGTEAKAVTSNTGLIGNLGEEMQVAAGMYIISENTLHLVAETGAAVCGQYKAYVDLSKVGVAQAPGRISLVVSSPSVATGLDAIEGTDAQKIMKDGQIYILRNGVIYSVTGKVVR